MTDQRPPRDTADDAARRRTTPPPAAHHADTTSPLDQHTDALRRQLNRAAAGQTRTRRRRLRTTVIAVPLAAAATFAAVALFPGERTSVLERATAALKPDSQVVHYRILTRTSGGDGNSACAAKGPDDAQQFWQETSATPRWRWLQPALDPGCGTMITGLGNTAAGPMDHAYDGTAVTTSDRKGRWIERITEPQGAFKQVPDLTGLGRLARAKGAGDPVTWLSDLMGSGRLKAEDHADVDGRPVLRFVGHSNTDGHPKITVSIDPKTYVPVRVVQQIIPPKSLDDPRLRDTMPTSLTIDFLIYEPASEADLTPELPTAPTNVDTMTQQEWRQAIRERQRKSSEEGRRYAQRMNKERREREARASR